MAEEVKEEVVEEVEEEKKKGVFGKVKDAILPDAVSYTHLTLPTNREV